MRTSSILDFKGLRERAGMSIAEAARYLEISERQVRRYEQGECKPPASTIRVLKTEGELRSAKPASANSAFRFIDLFAGIGF